MFIRLMIVMSFTRSARVSAVPRSGCISWRLVPRKETGLPLMRISPSFRANSRRPTRCESVSITLPAGSRSRRTAVYRFGCSADHSLGAGTAFAACTVVSSPVSSATACWRGRDQTAWPPESYSCVSTV